jgi:transposase
MQVDTDEPEIIERVAALDVAKAEVVCCARVPGPGGQRMQEVRTISTMTATLLALGDWLAELGVSRVVMEATSDYWRAPFYLLEDRFQTWLANAHDVKHLPGRPKTDRLDAVWLCKVAERQMLRPLDSSWGCHPQELQGTANLILVLEAHATAHSTAPGARLQNGLARPGDHDVNGRPRLIFSPERLSPAGDERDFRANGA